jgi:hypothetical protein
VRSPFSKDGRKLGDQLSICGQAPFGFHEIRAPVARRRIEERIEKFGANIKAEIGARIRVVSLLGLAVKACNR